MIKTIVAFLLTLFVATPVLAANPTATLRTDPARHYTYLTFSNLKSVSRVSYVLVYDSRSGQKGIEGGFKNPIKARQSTRRQILGTCSSSKCVYQANVKNLKLDVIFTLRSGGTVRASKSVL